jgi:apolipoprotein N-acyltransferase
MIGVAVGLVILRQPYRNLAWLLALPLLWLCPALPAPIPGSETAMVVQPNIRDVDAWTRPMLEQRTISMARRSISQPAGLILWPEVPAPFYYYTDPEFAEAARTVARTAGAYFLFGTVAYAKPGSPLNSAVMLDPAGNHIDRYDKIKLVPFGEFVPPFFGWINKITNEAGDFVPGSRRVVFPAGDHRLAAIICYEAAFPSLVREFTSAGAELIVNLSNDGYFGTSAAREQHLGLVRMRAIENRRWIIRATNDGISAVVDPGGRIVERLEQYRETSAVVHYGFVKETTFYARYGDWFAWSCLASAAVICILRFRAIRAGLPARHRP